MANVSCIYNLLIYNKCFSEDTAVVKHVEDNFLFYNLISSSGIRMVSKKCMLSFNV